MDVARIHVAVVSLGGPQARRARLRPQHEPHASFAMTLLDVLGCPRCKGSLERGDDRLHCAACPREYPIIDGVPILLPDGQHWQLRHEGDLLQREGYDGWIPRMVMQSLNDDQVVVDVGSGDMAFDDPCIIRMDAKLSRFTDVVGDAHALPFRSASVAYFFSLAMFEHLEQPFVAAEEAYRALKPGGYVYADCNFVFPFHGYPGHYFNASVQGLRRLFSRFRELKAGVAPYQMPSFAIESLLRTYLALFRPEAAAEVEFARSLEDVLRRLRRTHDLRLVPDSAFRVAAGDYFLGIKQPRGDESLLPAAVLEAYASSPELRARFQDPNDLAAPDNLMTWARGEGCERFPQIAAYFADRRPFSKYLDTRRCPDRSKVRSLPPIQHPALQTIVLDGEPSLVDMSGSRAASTPSACHVSAAPSAQNAIDIFRGEWTSALHTVDPTLKAGTVPVFDDPRIDWAVSRLGDVAGKTVLELGPLEGGHTYMLDRRRAAKVVAVESNTRAYLRCLIVKEILGLPRAQFLCGDFVEYLRGLHEKFDFVFASGVLYHQQNPVELISLLARASDRVFGWTHYYDAEVIAADTALAAKFGGAIGATFSGFPHVLHRYDYGVVAESPGFCGSGTDFSHWLDRADLLAGLRYFGFTEIDIGFDHPHHPNGPSLAFAAVRR